MTRCRYLLVLGPQAIPSVDSVQASQISGDGRGGGIHIGNEPLDGLLGCFLGDLLEIQLRGELGRLLEI